jgi:2-oxoglutarate dehydrogenase E2 component (dihydrolipoamide succinyltransferase)
MKKKIEVPSVGESITSGVITAWLAKDGQNIKEGQNIFELETDKATLEIPSPGTGILEILVNEGTEVEIGQTVAMLDSVQQPQRPAEPAPPAAPAPKKPPAEKKVTPPKAKEKPPAPSAKKVPDKKPQALKTKERRTERVQMSAIRRGTAERLVAAVRNSAYLTTFNEINMEKVIEIRAQYREKFQKEHGIKIGLMPFFIKACCQALKEFPVINTEIDGQTIIYKYFYDIGVAVSIDEGLLVPVIRDADTRHFAELESAIADLAQRAREKKLLPDELTGGTFTITNGGIFGSMLSTPIPAYPQTAILGMHAIKKRPAVAADDRIIVRPVMFVALTYDHRAIDGKDAIGFLKRVKEFIEEPDELLLEL